jgi:hypothetical protein
MHTLVIAFACGWVGFLAGVFVMGLLCGHR